MVPLAAEHWLVGSDKYHLQHSQRNIIACSCQYGEKGRKVFSGCRWSDSLNRPFAQLLPGLETGHPVTVGQSPAYDFSVSAEQKGVFLVSVSDCSECDSHPDAPSLTQAIIVQMVYSLSARDFSRTRPLSVSAFPRVCSPDTSKTIERTAFVDKVNRVGWRRWKRSSVALFLSKYDKHRKDGVSFHRFPRNVEFRRRLLSACSVASIAAQKLRKFVEKITSNGEWSWWTIHRWSKEAQWRKPEDFHSLVAGWDILEGAWLCPKSLFTPQEHVGGWRCLQTMASHPRQLQMYEQSFGAERTFSTLST